MGLIFIGTHLDTAPSYAHPTLIIDFDGAVSENRTHDLILTKDALYH